MVCVAGNWVVLAWGEDPAQTDYPVTLSGFNVDKTDTGALSIAKKEASSTGLLVPRALPPGHR